MSVKNNSRVLIHCTFTFVELTMEAMLLEVLSDKYQLATSDATFEDSVMMSCALLFRGDVTTCGINTAVEDLKRSQRIQFADWCPCGYKVATRCK